MLTLTIKSAEFEARMRHMFEAMEDRSELHHIAAEILFEETLERYRAGVDPEGNAWPDHAPVTRLLRGNRQGALLRQSGELYNSIIRRWSSDSAEVGTNLDHPKVFTHQFGATIKPKNAKALFLGNQPGGHGFFIRKAEIPARTYIGIGPGDGELVTEALIDYLEQ